MKRTAADPLWGDGRAVVRRPEARGSEVAKADLGLSAQEAAALSRTLVASVRRRSALSPEAMREQLRELRMAEIRGEG